MAIVTETILLDPRTFTDGTRQWAVPILKFPGVSVQDFYIDKSLVPKADYSVKGHLINVCDKYSINDDTKSYIIVAFGSSNTLVTFWAPIIIAILGLLGNITQPVLHHLQLLYVEKQPIAAEIHEWGYNSEVHEFKAIIHLKNLTTEEKRDWQLYATAHEYNSSIDPAIAKYDFISGPFELMDVMEISVPSSKEFTDQVKQHIGLVQGCIFLAKKGLKLQKGFCPGEHPDSEIRLLSRVGCSP
jgi:hypothetical protein